MSFLCLLIGHRWRYFHGLDVVRGERTIATFRRCERRTCIYHRDLVNLVSIRTEKVP